MEFRLKITIQARRDFNSIADLTASDSKDFGERLLALAQSLTTFPYRHGSWAGNPYIRKVPFASYVIFYKIHEKERVVEILRFWPAACDLRRLRLKEETTQPYQAVKLEA